MTTEGAPTHCHNCGYIAEVEDNHCSNCGAPPDEFSTPAESAERFRETVDAVTGDGDE